jgi:Fe-S cluster biogenesis protein NfuA
VTLNPWLLLGVALAWIASLVWVGSWQNEAGHTAERVSWQTKENAELVAANTKIQRLNAEARATEQAHQTNLADIGAQHEKDKADAEARRIRDVDDARSGALKLRVAGACKGAGSSGTTQAPAAAGQRDEATTAELPGEVAANLFALADDADEQARQLTACQAVIVEDRRERP